MLKALVPLFVITAALFPIFSKWYYTISVEKPEAEYDFIIVGAGISGSVLANRLSEDKNNKVLLVEAGGEDQPNFKIALPLFSSWNVNSDVDWKYKSAPQEHSSQNFNNRQLMLPRGLVLGGTSTINAMVFMRGSAHDYNSWEEMGATGWGYKDVLPFFKKLENASAISSRSKGRGVSGPLKLSYPYTPLISRYFVAAGKELGYSSGDYNSENVEGFHYVQATVARGRRQDASYSYLRPVAKKRQENLHILTQSQARKIMLERNEKDETQAKGVIVVKNNRDYEIKARKEVIVSAGSYGTPQLLMLSGIGPRDHLESVQIEPIINLPGVGSNLQDHVAMTVCWVAKKIGTNDVMQVQNDIFKKIYQWFSSDNGGPLGSNGIGAQAVLRSNLATGPRADLQLFISSTKWESGRWFGLDNIHNYNEEYLNKMKESAEKQNRTTACDFTISNIALRTHSQGHVRLTSKDFRVPPVIDPKYLSDDRDLNLLVEGLRIMESMEDTDAFKNLGAKLNLLFNECEGQERPRSQTCLEAAARGISRTVHHPTTTAKMGKKEDPYSVVDSRLRVYGIEGLRIADASVMPEVPSTPLQAPCYMIGEKAADMIKRDWNIK